ncbi:hypothetical protein ACLKA7_010503 [Drosophila subpalustris]
MRSSYLTRCASDKRNTVRMSNARHHNILNCPLTMLSSDVQISHLISFSKAFLIFFGLLALGNAASFYEDVDVPTVAPGGTTVAPGGTTAAPGVTTAAPGGTTVAPGGTTAAPGVTTAAPGVTTAAPGVTTVAPGGTTAVPANPTVPNPGTTVAPGGTTAVPTPPGKCVYATQAWGVPDVRQLAFCLDGQERLTECNEDEYFVSNDEISGCVPADIISPNCVNLDVTVGPCTGINLKQLQISESLTGFWFCEEEGAAPVELFCENGKAFLKQDGYMGCFEWTQWRKLRGCQTYTNSP